MTPETKENQARFDPLAPTDGQTASILVTIDESGKVIAAEPSQGNPAVTSAALSALADAEQLHFTPATRNGRRVKSVGLIDYVFTDSSDKTKPQLVFTKQEDYQASGQNWTRYYLSVTNRASYPNEMFAPAPNLPPCGLNKNSSRTWLDIYDQAETRLIGFCAVISPDGLGNLWFTLPQGQAPPSHIFIVLTDRQTNAKYKSALLAIPLPGTNDVPKSTNPSGKPGAVVKNQIGMELVYVPAGSFMMGSENGEADEKPVHLVTLMVTETDRAHAAGADTEVETTERELKRAKQLLDANVLSQSDYDQAQIRHNEAKAKRAAIRTTEGFYMGRYEVTQAQWQSVMGNNPSYFKACGGNCPVEQVSWDDAQSFISKLNQSNDGFRYRLPTEAEWEYACRAGTTGDYAGNVSEMAWYLDNSGVKTHAVGGKQPNAWGLADMHGNVWEWCQDWHHETYYGAPTDGSAWLSVGEQKYRVLRGGSWNVNATRLRSAYRDRSTPGNRLSFLGFRVVGVR